VVLDEPMIGRYGGDLAGPVFRRVAEASLRYLGVPPANAKPQLKNVKAQASTTPDRAPAVETALADGLEPPTDPPVVPVTVGPPPPSSVKVPDASGMGARAAVRAVGAAGLVP